MATSRIQSNAKTKKARKPTKKRTVKKTKKSTTESKSKSRSATKTTASKKPSRKAFEDASKKLTKSSSRRVKTRRKANGSHPYTMFLKEIKGNPKIGQKALYAKAVKSGMGHREAIAYVGQQCGINFRAHKEKNSQRSNSSEYLSESMDHSYMDDDDQGYGMDDGGHHEDHEDHDDRMMSRGYRSARRRKKMSLAYAISFL